MSERNLDFDVITERRNTKSVKYDSAIKRGKPADAIPLWVADMDFKTSSYITDALEKMVSNKIFGYSEGGDSYFEAVREWMKRRHQWEVEESWMIQTPGVVFALAMAVRAFTKEGDSVLIQQPVYYPFREIITDNHRKLVSSTLVQTKDGSYHIDYEDFEQKIVTEHVKLFILCNPHNPVGRVWTKEELSIIGDICLKHHIIVASDEIHSDFVFFGKKHHVFSSINENYRDNCIICTSPSKTFNLAGFQISNIFIENTALAKAFRKEIKSIGYSQVGLTGLIACESAYRYGDEWLEGVLKYIQSNAEFAETFLIKNLPKVKMSKLEGTYLIWLDFKKYGLLDHELDKMILYDAGLWLDSGGLFGKAGEGFQRVNIACPRVILEQALKKLQSVFQ